MTRHKRARSEPARAEADAPQEKSQNQGMNQNPGTDQKQPTNQRDWADDAAQARTTDDPRRRSPHDASGVPSSGDNR